MTKVQIVKNRKINLSTLYNRIKKRILDDRFHITSEVETDYVYHLRAEKTGVTEIIIGTVKDIELIIAGESESFAIIFTVGAWGKNIVTSGSTGYVVTSLIAGPAIIYGTMAATGSFVRAMAFEQDFWQQINKEIEAISGKPPAKEKEED